MDSQQACAPPCLSTPTHRLCRHLVAVSVGGEASSGGRRRAGICTSGAKADEGLDVHRPSAASFADYAQVCKASFE